MTKAADWPTGEQRSYSAAGKLSWFLASTVLSDSLGLIQNHCVSAVISSLSISISQQVEQHQIIKMSRGKCYSHREIVANQHILKLSTTREVSWKVASHWKSFTDGLLC